MAIFGVVPRGVCGSLFEVEIATGSRGRGIRISGNIDKVVNEGTTRISKALDSSGFPVSQALYEINLHPASMLKCGTSCDLPIAVAILVHSALLCDDDADHQSLADSPIGKRNTERALEHVDALLLQSHNRRKDTDNLLRWLNAEDALAVGELRFDASVTRPHGIFGMLASAVQKKQFRIIIVPSTASEECRLLLSHPQFADAKIVCVDRLQEAYQAMSREQPSQHLRPFTRDALTNKATSSIDLRDVKGQAIAKRALEVAAAGGHNVLLVGPPGEGKTMLLKAFSGILPPPTLGELFDINAVYSARGLLEEDEIKVDRPYREVPATATRASIFGGVFSGRLLSPGEISLAHHGALIMDELPQRSRDLLEELRTPLQDKSYTLAKYGAAMRFPSNFIFLGAMNPCPCGFYGEFVCERCGETMLNLASGCKEHGLRFKKNKCRCAPTHVHQYNAKISGPLLDRIDIIARVSTLNVKERLRRRREESSKSARQRVREARDRQRVRYEKLRLKHVRCNADLSERVIEYVQITESARSFVKVRSASMMRRVSTRKFNQLLKVARTIADLEASPGLHRRHIIEAITMMGIYDDPEEYFVVDSRNIHTRLRQEMYRRRIQAEQIAAEARLSTAQIRGALSGDEQSEELVEGLSRWYWNSVEK